MQNSHRLLVTGGSGFLGAHVMAAASGLGISAVAAVRSGSDLHRLNALAAEADIVVCDITGPFDALVKVLCDVRPTAVVHCAAYGVDYRQADMQAAVRVNIVGSIRLIEAARAAEIQYVVHVGTAQEYGFCEGFLDERAALKPPGLYGLTKAAGALSVLDAASRHGIIVAAARPFGIYGPFEGSHKFVPSIMQAGLTGTPIELTPALQERDYTYVGDVASGLVKLATTRLNSSLTLNLCSGRAISLRALGEAAIDSVGGDQTLLRWGAKPYRSDEVMRLVGDARLASRILDWHALISLQTGMALTAEAERRRKNLKIT